MTISYFVVNILYSFIMLYSVSKILDSKLNFKNYKLYVACAALTLYSFFVYQVTHSFLRAIILVQLYIICNYFLHHKNGKRFEEITIASIIGWLILFIVETLTALILFIVIDAFKLDNLLIFANDFISTFIVINVFLISSNHYACRLFRRIVGILSQIKLKSLLFGSIYISLLLSSTMYLIFFDISKASKAFLLLTILIEYGIGSYYIISDKKKKNELQKEFDLMLEVTSNYEKLLEDFRINSHENKNQLIVIKGLIDPKNKNALNYVKNMIKTNFKDDDNIMLKVSKIPIGGLRGLIYYKLLAMQSLKINFVLNISKEIERDIFKDLDVSTIQNYYKIVGVILDNAIEATKMSNDKSICVEIYIKNGFFIVSLTNEYFTNIDFENLGKKKYSTKGNNHGYGLQLVERLVAADKNLMNEKEIIGQVFVQKAGIKIKK